MRLALVTCRAVAQPNADESLLIAAAQARGLEVDRAVWDDPEVDWESYDAILLRSTWDYHKNLAAFCDWLEAIESSGLAFFNPTSLVRWNLDKHYLLDLAQAGIAIPPSRFISTTETVQIEAAIDDLDSDDIVIKPSVSATAWRTRRLHREDCNSIRQAVAEILRDSTALLQPYLPEIEAGEMSLLFFAGTYSHAVMKHPRPGDFRVQHDFGGRYEAIEPDSWIIEAAAHALAVASPQPLYARVDGVISGDAFLLMELELIEPDLMLTFAPDGAKQLLSALLNK